MRLIGKAFAAVVCIFLTSCGVKSDVDNHSPAPIVIPASIQQKPCIQSELRELINRGKVSRFEFTKSHPRFGYYTAQAGYFRAWETDEIGAGDYGGLVIRCLPVTSINQDQLGEEKIWAEINFEVSQGVTEFRIDVTEETGYSVYYVRHSE